MYPDITRYVCVNVSASSHMHICEPRSKASMHKRLQKRLDLGPVHKRAEISDAYIKEPKSKART
jgi:hypothetical protein